MDRRTVDLSAYPDLVVIYLGMRVNVPTGLKTLFGFRPEDQSGGRASAGRAAAPRIHRLFCLPAAYRHAPVLARLRCARALGALRAPSHLVAEVLARLAPGSGTRPI